MALKIFVFGSWMRFGQQMAYYFKFSPMLLLLKYLSTLKLNDFKYLSPDDKYTIRYILYQHWIAKYVFNQIWVICNINITMTSDG